MTSRAIDLLDRLISTPSVSRDEGATATIIEHHLLNNGVQTHRIANNVWASSRQFDPELPTLLLNSHHDTVKPVSAYTRDPFEPTHADGRIYGLGSNDAGASVVALVETFLRLYDKKLSVNLILAITAEEEVSGRNGIELLLAHFRDSGLKIDMAIVGEPTCLQAAIAERGLMVVDFTAKGISGHAAREEGVNAIYKAFGDINRLRKLKLDKRSQTLGDIKISVTQISAGTQHNVIPDTCSFVADIRTTDAYTNDELIDILSQNVESQFAPRSTRLHASAISVEHPLVKIATALGASTFVSPTLSDRALMHGIPALKIGPGDSARSHTADEFVYEKEIEQAIEFYQHLILSL